MLSTFVVAGKMKADYLACKKGKDILRRCDAMGCCFFITFVTIKRFQRRKENRIMTTMELNAELFRQLSIIAEDETLMRKAVKAIRKLAQKKEEENKTEYISKEEILEGIDAGLKDLKAGRTRPAEELLKELRDEL